jgi:hypothetical protein
MAMNPIVNLKRIVLFQLVIRVRPWSYGHQVDIVCTLFVKWCEVLIADCDQIPAASAWAGTARWQKPRAAFGAGPRSGYRSDADYQLHRFVAFSKIRRKVGHGEANTHHRR